MNVTIDPHSGFCFGVVHAIQAAENELKKGGSFFCLGDIVHNTMEVNRLKELGLRIINHEEFRNLKDCKVMIRAHGEPPETYAVAERNNIELVDASCSVVLRLQKNIRDHYNAMKSVNGQIVIYGKEGHAEVKGLQGQTEDEAIVVRYVKDLERIDFSRPVRLFSQTTMSVEGFREMAEMIGERMKRPVSGSVGDFIRYDSICRQVANRSEQVKSFASEHEVIIFVSGKKSSNGMYLYETCKQSNELTYLIGEKQELRAGWLVGVNSVGICGATSTPRWLMEEVAEEVKRINLQEDVS